MAKHCFHAAATQVTTWRQDEPRVYICCYCGHKESVTPALVPTGHGPYAQDGERFQKRFKMPEGECPPPTPSEKQP